MADPGFEEGGGGARGYYPQKIMIEGEKRKKLSLQSSLYKK